jgi:6-phosphofructokinase
MRGSASRADARTRAGIVTCSGLCPGLNNVIRTLFFELHHTYGAAEVLGFRGGYQGLDPARGPEPVSSRPHSLIGSTTMAEPYLALRAGPVDMAAARNAVHAAMAGKTRLVIGLLHDLFIQIPIELLALEKKHIDPFGIRWISILA